MFYKSQEEIMLNWEQKYTTPILSIICITYNHEKYIKEALDSMLMQETNFPFEIIIGEDCSPDNTKDILIKYKTKYPKIIKPILRKKNIGAYKNEEECILLAKGKYIAFLEGDDFWVDKNKSQKQVDFLNNNIEYGLVHGDVNHLYESSGKILKKINHSKNSELLKAYTLSDLVISGNHFIKTMTVCLRKDIFIKYIMSSSLNNSLKFFDMAIWFAFASYSKIYYMDEVFATYRLGLETMSRTQNCNKLHKMHKKIYKIRFFYINKFLKKNIKLRRIVYHMYLRASVRDACCMNDLYKAMHFTKLLLKQNSFLSLKELKSVIYLLIKKKGKR